MARRHIHTDTSAEALASLDPRHVKNQCDRIEAAIRASRNGRTILELEKITSIVSSTICARLGTLRKEGRVHESITRRPCEVNGRNKKVWILADDSGQMTLGRTA